MGMIMITLRSALKPTNYAGEGNKFSEDPFGSEEDTPEESTRWQRKESLGQGDKLGDRSSEFVRQQNKFDNDDSEESPKPPKKSFFRRRSKDIIGYRAFR